MDFIAFGVTIWAILVIRTDHISKVNKLRPLAEVVTFKEIPFVVHNPVGFVKFLGFYTPFVYIPIYPGSHLQSGDLSPLECIQWLRRNAKTSEE